MRCLAWGARAFMHAGLISYLKRVLKDAGLLTSATFLEARGLRGIEHRTRPGDIVVLDYVAPDKHIVLDGVVEGLEVWLGYLCVTG